MPHHRIGAVAGVDAQFTLPGVVLELQFALMLEHPLASAIDPQFTFLLANLAIELVVTLCSFEPRQRYLIDVTNTPVSVQCMAQLARQLVVMLGAQAQFQGVTQVRVQVHLPVAQLQLPVQAHAVVIGAAVEQFPVDQAGPSVGRPGIFAGVATIPRPAHRYAAPNGADLWPLGRAPQPWLLAGGLKMQQLRTLATEHRLAQGVVDHQHIAHLKALPGEHRTLAQGFEKALQRLLVHVPRSRISQCHAKKSG
ncbi:hypothetical protein PFLmoz3_05574 [Pseudomonas fluorescens]|uniref:Uncharacterized protein n=1 Tax=Pseudomonas fluorescens TaxID=294 RepID=A0A120G5R2_PSEFL|nr:hypothetical protein PFLmoz3_05574 [Pseudomonas fluorescens]